MQGTDFSELYNLYFEVDAMAATFMLQPYSFLSMRQHSVMVEEVVITSSIRSKFSKHFSDFMAEKEPLTFFRL